MDKRMKTTLLKAYRSASVMPRLGASMSLNVSALERLEELCDERYAQCDAIIIRGFIRTSSTDFPNEDMVTMDVRLVLRDTNNCEIMNDYSLLCRFPAHGRGFEVMTIA